MALHRVPRKQLDANIFYIDDDMDRIVGLDRTTVQVHDHLLDSGDLNAYHKGSNIGFDPTTNPLTTTNVQYALSEFANRPIANPVRETSVGDVFTTDYLIQSSVPAYVGINPGDNPNKMFAVYDLDGNELPIDVLGVTSDSAGTNSIIGLTWYKNPYLQLSSSPNETIIVKYGVQSSLGELPIDALLKEGVISAEVDSDVIFAIADIKGTVWDSPVPNDRDLVGLDARINTIVPFLHEHRYDILPIGTQDGTNDTFTLPGSEVYISGTLQVFLNGTKIPGVSIAEIVGLTSFKLLVQTEQLPDSAVNDTLEINYILG